MKAEYTFEQVARYSDDWPMPGVVIYARPVCRPSAPPMMVAVIIEPASGNPCIMVPRPLGLNALEEILAKIKEHSAARKAATA